MPDNNNEKNFTSRMYEHLKSAKDLSQYTLFRGTTDFTNLKQFDYYESGFPLLMVVKVPKFLEEIASGGGDGAAELKTLLYTYRTVLEREFIGFDSGLENISSETQEINNGLQSVNVISKTNAPSASTFSMTFNERAGTPLTRLHEYYLRSIADPNTGYKTYNGYIGNGKDPDQVTFADECFSFLYMHTDNTGLLLERAVYLTCCQPTEAQLEIYNGRKGDITFQQVTPNFNGIPIMGKEVDRMARKYLEWLNDTANNKYANHRISWNYNYEATKADGEMEKNLTERQKKYTGAVNSIAEGNGN